MPDMNVHGSNGTKTDDLHVVFILTVDEYCLQSAPEDPTCAVTDIWTFDKDDKECKQTKGCFPDGGPEYNMFPSERGCIMWCSKTYE